MALGEQRHQQPVDDRTLADDHSLNLGPDAIGRFLHGLDGRRVEPLAEPWLR